MKNKLFNIITLSLCILAGFSSCSDDDDPALKNDLLKKTYGPMIVGNTIEFAYALGAPDGGILRTAEVTASIPGAQGTGISKKSRYTNTSGNEVPVVIATDSTTNGAVSKVSLVDTIAATVRYFYVIPEEARGKQLSFTFSGTSTTGSASYTSDTYTVSNMDIKTKLQMTLQKCYFSVATMQAYTKAEVEAQGLASQIDLVFVDKATMGSGWNFGRAFVAPSNDKDYLTADEIPAEASNKTLIERRYWPDGQLKTGNIQTVFIDDIDLRQAAFDGTLTYAYGFGNDQGALVKTADGKYAAYIYLNTYSSGTLTFGIKRLAL